MEITSPHNPCSLSAIDRAALLVGGRSRLAVLLGVTPAAIGNWKFRGIPSKHCMEIEVATAGLVGRMETCPTDWQKYWPELAPAGASIAPVASESVAQGVAHV